jgi:glycosyltransferase involved in cell wall biosynthesis
VNFIQENIPHNFKKEGKTITFMGRLVKQKGIATLIECMPEIIAKVSDAHLNIIGPLSGMEITNRSKSDYVKKLERRIRELRLSNRVHFKGVQLGLDKYRLLSESDIFINPTIALEETFGIVNIDALACGIPIIATDWAANKEIIAEGKNGFLVDVNYDQDKNPKIDTKQLISLIIKVLKDEKLRLKIRRDSLKTAPRYDYRKVIPRLLTLLKKKVTIRVENKWDSIKNRRVIDFRQFFNKKSFFFISLIYFFRKFTYGSLYKHIFGRVSLKRKNSSTNRKNIRRGEAKNIEIAKRLRQEYKDFLLLKK